MSEAAAKALDAADSLARYRSRFALPEGTAYLKGNSLGAMPLPVDDTVRTILDQWRTRQGGGHGRSERGTRAGTTFRAGSARKSRPFSVSKPTR